MDLDHIALATLNPTSALAQLVGELGATITEGGDAPDFRWVQSRVGDGEKGMTVEVITPRPDSGDSFLTKFIARHGEGQHHITFKVDSLRDAIDQATLAGYHPTGISFEDPEWFEAFLSPREAQGTVIQLAQVNPSPGTWIKRWADHAERGTPLGRPIWWEDAPEPATDRAFLKRIVMRTDSITSSLGLWCGLLGGVPEYETDESIDLSWPGGRILVVEDPGSTPGFERLEVESLVAMPSTRIAGAAIHFSQTK